MNDRIRSLGREAALLAAEGQHIAAYAVLDDMRLEQDREAERRREDMRAFLAGEVEQVS